MSKQSKCIYCGLKLRGRGCPYSPAKVHIHPTPNKCIYCGLTLRGRGCQYAPNGIHIRFMDFGAIQSEQTQNHLLTGYLVERLRMPFVDTAAYKLGVIDEDGYQIKTPETVMEERSFTPLDKYIFRLRRSFGDKIDALNSEMLLEGAFKTLEGDTAADDFDASDYLKKVDTESDVKIKLARVMSEYYNCLREATEAGVSTPKIEQILLQVLTEHDDSQQNPIR